MRLARLLLPLALAVAAIGPLAALGGAEQPAWAAASFDAPWGYTTTWNAAVRLVRVDRGFTITEKDEAGGYLLFEYRSPEGGKKGTPGSIEIVRGPRDDAPVKVLVKLPQMPGYHEQVLANDLQKKLRAEYGEPKAPARAPADAGVDSGSP